MSQINIDIEVALNGEEHKINKVLSLQPQEVEALLPIYQECDPGWAYWNYADEIASRIVADELLQDNLANKENSKDLKTLGITRMRVVFSSAALNRSNTVTFIA